MATDKKATTITEAVGTVIAKVCYEAADEIGSEIATRMRKWRQRNAIKTIEHVGELYQANKISGNEHAPPKIVYQVIEHASWVDDEELQKMWAGLIISACTEKGLNDENSLFVTLLSQLTSLEAVVLNYACENCAVELHTNGLLVASGPTVTEQELIQITSVSDIHRLDRELDHMRQAGVIHAGFDTESSNANIAPTTLGLQMYARCKGHIGSIEEFYNLKKSSDSNSNNSLNLDTR